MSVIFGAGINFSFLEPNYVLVQDSVCFRVIYFNLTEQGTIILITLYKKTIKDNIPASDIQKAV